MFLIVISICLGCASYTGKDYYKKHNTKKSLKYRLKQQQYSCIEY